MRFRPAGVALMVAALAAPAARAQAPVRPDTAFAAADSLGESGHDESTAPVDTVLTPADTAFVRLPADSTHDGPVDYLWVVRTSMLSARDIDRLVARAQGARVRGLLVQVVGRGDSYYLSDLLPRAEALPRAVSGQPPFDPLGYLLPRAHAVGLEVHAWMNACLVWSAPTAPRDPRHVVNQHPEWIARLRDGRPMTRLTARQRARMGVEGVFVNPAHPAVRTWIAQTATEIATRYDVDGIHLDYIRLPAADVGFDPTTRARFALESGVDPLYFDRVPRERRAAVEAEWRAFLSAQVTAIVHEVRDSLERTRPQIRLSVAVLADTITAERHRGQAWRAWVRDGLIDRAFLMNYAPSVQTVMNQLLAFGGELGATGRVVPGIACYNTAVSAVAAKIKGARALGYRLLALYSYDTLYRRHETWPTLLSMLEPASRPAPGR